MTGCVVARACFDAWRFGEESQQRVTPQVWHVLRCTQREWVLTHSWHSRASGGFTSATFSMCPHFTSFMTSAPPFPSRSGPLQGRARPAGKVRGGLVRARQEGEQRLGGVRQRPDRAV